MRRRYAAHAAAGAGRAWQGAGQAGAACFYGHELHYTGAYVAGCLALSPPGALFSRRPPLGLPVPLAGLALRGVHVQWDSRSHMHWRGIPFLLGVWEVTVQLREEQAVIL